MGHTSIVPDVRELGGAEGASTPFIRALLAPSEHLQQISVHSPAVICVWAPLPISMHCSLSPGSSPGPISSSVAVHACVLQLCEEAPEQLAPPPDGGGLVQVCVWVPPPQETLQAPQSLQPPSTGAGNSHESPSQVLPDMQAALPQSSSSSTLLL